MRASRQKKSCVASQPCHNSHMRKSKEVKQSIYNHVVARMNSHGRNGGRTCSPIGLMFGYQYTTEMDGLTVEALMRYPEMRCWRRHDVIGLIVDLQEVWDVVPPLRWGDEFARIARHHDLSPVRGG